jgi:hypothetical protein
MAFCFAAGYFVAKSPTSTDRTLPDIVITPERLSVNAINVSVNGPATSFFRNVLPEVSEPNGTDIEPVKLSLPASLQLRGGSTLNYNQRSTPVAIINSASAVGGVDVVWTANEIVAGEARSTEDACVLEASKALLFFALCDPSSHDLPTGETNITQTQEAQLSDALAAWGVKDYTSLELDPVTCIVRGSRFQLEAIRVEVASFFNRQRWKQR